MWPFKRKTLDEKIQIVKDYTQKHELSGKHANLVYFDVAYHVFGWEDAALDFMRKHLKESVNKIV